MKRVYIGVGSNLGLREEYILKARIILSHYPHIRFLRHSSTYETEPMGGPPQGKFLNVVWEIETDFSPKELLQTLLQIEKSLGRERDVKNGPRTIDLDILFYEDLVINEPELAIPHPEVASRWFVLKPLCDLVPELIHPISGKSVSSMLEECHAAN